LPETSERLHASPSMGLLGCSFVGLPALDRRQTSLDTAHVQAMRIRAGRRPCVQARKTSAHASLEPFFVRFRSEPRRFWSTLGSFPLASYLRFALKPTVDRSSRQRCMLANKPASFDHPSGSIPGFQFPILELMMIPSNPCQGIPFQSRFRLWYGRSFRLVFDD